MGEEVVKRATKIKRKNRRLSDKNSELEQTLGRTIREVKKEHVALVLAHTEKTASQEEELEIMKKALHIQKTELKRVRKHAMEILKRRTECEQFLYEALEEVKEQIRESKRFEMHHGNIWKNSG